MNTNESNRIRLTSLFFYLGFFLMFLSGFLTDVNQSRFSLQEIADFLRYGSYLFFVFSVLLSKRSLRVILCTVLLMIFGSVIFVSTGVFQLLVFFLIAFAACEEDNRTIVYFSYRTLLFLYTVVFLLCAVGLLENSVTHRYIGDGNPRYTLGFYHSNVPPLIFLYLLAYRILLKRENFSWSDIGWGTAMSVVLYQLCDSRTSFALTLTLMLAMVIIKLHGAESHAYTLVYVGSRYVTLFWIVFSVLGFIMLENSVFIQRIDSLLSYRFTLSARAYAIYGLHLITEIDTNTFFSDGIVVDNGYAFLLLRYGVVTAVLFGLLFWYFAKKRSKDIFVSLVLIVIASTNFIDNDLLDYSCLPFLIIALKQLLSGSKRNTSNIQA